MTTGIKEAISDIKYGDPTQPYAVRYNIPLDKVFALGALTEFDMLRLADYIEEEDDRFIADGYIRWNWMMSLEDAEALVEEMRGSVEIAKDLWEYDPPTISAVKRWLEDAGADFMRQSYIAGVPLEHIICEG